MAKKTLGIIGRKLGMTRVFSDDGSVVPVTVIAAGPCPVMQIRTQEKDGYTALQREVRCAPPHADTRLDALLSGPNLPPLWVEAKSVTLREGDVALFPDAATSRGQKHLRVLMDLKAQGCRCACFYLIQRGDVSSFAPAADIDPAYAELFYAALAAGVEIYAYRAVITEAGIDLGDELVVYAPGRGT